MRLSLLFILAILVDRHRGGLDLPFVPASFVSLGTFVAHVIPVLLRGPSQTLLHTGAQAVQVHAAAVLPRLTGQQQVL